MGTPHEKLNVMYEKMKEPHFPRFAVLICNKRSKILQSRVRSRNLSCISNGITIVEINPPCVLSAFMNRSRRVRRLREM